MKKVLSIILSASVVASVSLAACGSSNPNSDSDSNVNEITCSNCDAEISEDARFCPDCGAIVRNVNNKNTEDSDIIINDAEENDDTDKTDERAYDWNEVYLSKYLPEPKSNHGVVQGNSLEDLYMIVDETSHEDFEAYVDACSKKGFNIDADNSAGEYKAYSSDGGELSLEYFEYDEAMHIDLKMLVTETIRWQDIYFAKLLPTPNSTRGNVKNNNDVRCDLYLGNIAEKEYNSYVDECKEKGFTLETMEMENYYFAKNNDGYELTLEHYGCDVMYLELYDPDWESR